MVRHGMAFLLGASATHINARPSSLLASPSEHSSQELELEASTPLFPR